MGARERGDNLEIILQTIEHGGKLFVLLEEDTGRLVGSSWITFDGRRLFIHHFGISKEYRRKGWGTKLLKESLKFVKESGYQVKLEVHRNNIPAINLYQKVGFKSYSEYILHMIRKPGEIKL